jgi:serine phosphatase RsbU (regulator of sigma subunit)
VPLPRLSGLETPQPDQAVERRRLEGLNRLLEVTHILAAEIEPTKLLGIIIQEACRALDCERATLYQYDEKRNELYTTVATELELGEIRKSVDSGISGYVARHRQMQNVPDPASDARWDNTYDLQSGFHTRSILALPLLSAQDGRLLGVLELFNNHSGPFDLTDEEFALAFAQHSAAALDRARLVRELQAQQEVEASLNVAREIQRRFMPRTMPQTAGYEAAVWWLPNQAVGGDYCDLWQLSSGQVGFCVADVSGHGIGPSLLMASVRACLRTLLLDHTSPTRLMETLSRAIADDLQHGNFVTMILGLLDPRRHTMTFANAGHGPAFHRAFKTGVITELRATGVPLGVLDEADYPIGPEIVCEAGDLILCCTDGIVECTDRHGEPFGNRRLEAFVDQHAADPPAVLVRAIGETVQQFYDGASPPDDLTILAIRRNPA